MIRLNKLSLNHNFWGFIILLRPVENEMSLSHYFFPSVWYFLICFYGNIDVVLDSHYGLDDFILTTWTLSPCEIVELKLMRYIPQHLYIRIFTFLVFVFHLFGLSSFTRELISQPETRQIFGLHGVVDHYCPLGVLFTDMNWASDHRLK